MILILLFFGLVLFSYREVLSKKTTFLHFYILILIIALVEGLRWNSGVDFQMYYNSYSKLFENVTEIHNSRYDTFYLLLTKFFKIFNIHYTFLLLGMSLFTGILYLLTIKKYTAYPIFALLCLFVTLIGFWGNNRQLIALSIVFFAIRFLIEKKYLLFVICVFIASGFHFTAIAMLILPICNIEFKQNRLWLVSIIGLFLIFLFSEKSVLYFLEYNKQYLPHLYQRFKGYEKYNDIDVDFLILTLGVLRKLMPICFLLYFRNTFNKLEGYNFFLNISILSLIVYLWAKFSFSYLAGRFTIYFSIYECITYSWFGYLVLSSKYKRIFFAGFIVFFGIIFWKSIELYPHLFIPYNTLFFSF